MIAVHTTHEDVQFTVDAPKIDPICSADLCHCGEESDYGAHGIRDGAVYSEYFCKSCHNKNKREL